MEYRRLGRTGVSVSKLCLGAMMFGDWGTKDHKESIRIIGRALDAGINFIDTADVYSGGESEVIVGEALAGGRRDGIVLASKVHMPMGEDPNQRGNSRRWIIAGCPGPCGQGGGGGSAGAGWERRWGWSGGGAGGGVGLGGGGELVGEGGRVGVGGDVDPPGGGAGGADGDLAHAGVSGSGTRVIFSGII